MKALSIISLAAAMGLAAGAATAGDEAWGDLRTMLYDDDRTIAEAGSFVAFDPPYRTMNDLRTVLGAEVVAPIGATIAKVSLIVDNNPMPVSAEFEMLAPTPRFSFSTTMRLDRSTPVRVVMETTEGALYMSEAYVKTAGVGACAAPPGTDPVTAAATLGQMALAAAAKGEEPLARLASLTGKTPRSEPAAVVHRELQIKHPSLSGMQKDQITLLYIPARYVEEIAVSTDGQPRFKMTGSISLSENPAISFDLPADAVAAEVTLIDSDGAAFTEVFAVGGAS